ERLAIRRDAGERLHPRLECQLRNMKVGWALHSTHDLALSGPVTGDRDGQHCHRRQRWPDPTRSSGRVLRQLWSGGGGDSGDGLQVEREIARRLESLLAIFFQT